MLVKLNISDKLIKKLTDLLPNKVSEILLKANKDGFHVSEYLPNEGYADYLNIKDKQISHIKESSRKKNNVENPWLKSRQTSQPGGVLSKIFTNDFIRKSLTNTDNEVFSNKWNASNLEDYKIEILRGWDCLEAFNINKKIDTTKMVSCANMYNKGGHPSPLLKWYYVYVYNPDNFGVVVLRDKKTKMIVARAPLFQGYQQFDDGEYKAGNWYRFLNGVYGTSDIFKSAIRNWAQSKRIPYWDKRDTFKGHFFIKMKTNFKTYPPLDNFFVDSEKDILSTTNKRIEGYNFRSAYKLRVGNGNHQGKNGTNQFHNSIFTAK